MLIGAHVSPAGGLWRAVERGSALGAQAIQIFNQSPRMWKPTTYRDEDVAAFSILIIVLIFLPTGILGRPEVEKV